jgi:predicted ATPase/tetratricopeptide (TPR) repeat protein
VVAGLSFVGREAELEILEARVGSSRLVSVVGPPGVGKSALLAELGRSRALGDRMARVVCEERHTARSLGEALLAAAGSSEVVPQGSEAEEIAAFARLAVRGRRGVLVFDDADACLPVVTRFVAACLAASVASRCVVTSRERLRLQGESLVVVDPLGLPEETDDPDEAFQSPAVQLLVSRAQAADGRFRLTRQNTRAVTALVRALEGLPLAIVSFAGRFGAVGASELARQAERRVGLFSAREIDTVSRARSIEGAMDASWASLPEDLRDALATLSVVEGAFGIEGAMAVLDHDESPKARARVGQTIEALIDRSLLRVVWFDEPRRYTMLRGVREYARERLQESGREGQAIRAMVRRFAALPRPRAYGDPRLVDFDPLTYEQAFREAMILGLVDEAARLALALGTSYLRRGPFGKYAELLSSVLARAEGSSEELRAELYLDRGLAHLLGGQRDSSYADFEAAARSGRAETRALALSKLGLAVGLSGRFEEARLHFEEARAVVSGRELPDVEGRIHKDAANVFSEEGTEEAHSALVAARACFVRSGNLRERAFVELLLASRLCDEGKLPAARRMAEEVVEAFVQVGDERSLGWAHTIGGLVEQEQGRFGVARERYAQALEVTKRVGDVQTEGLVLGYLAGLELELGEAHEAVLRGGEALHALEVAGARHATSMVHAVVGCGYAALGHRRLAEQAFASARAAAHDDGRAARWVGVELLSFAAFGEPPGKRDEVLARSPVTEEVRFALRYLGSTERSIEAPVPSSRTVREVVMGDDGAWIRGPGGRVLELAKRPVLRRLVHALAREREKAPGKAVSAPRLLRHIWPNEKILERAAMNRLYVAITRLRDEGLVDAIVRTAEGYLLSPEIGFRRERGPAPPAS